MDTLRAAVGWGLVASAGAAAATAVAAPLYEHPGGPALLAELNHPVLLAVLAVLALAGAALLRSRRPDVRRAAGAGLALSVVLGVLAVPAYGVVTDPMPMEEWDVPAPDGAPRRLVVEQTSALTDPVWRIYVDAGTFPTARRWPVAEYRSDPESAFTKGVLGARWTDADHVRIIDLDHGHHDLRIGPDGRPLDRLDW
ncbi:hypothetical protein ACIPW5_24150 [Streptomyces sp. NPDC090077]|uniref:hypothetical protein n=1 Tax=Streptomyces sp. NPDC090077 TaxID=3365938 RepID=UPI00381D4796